MRALVTVLLMALLVVGAPAHAGKKDALAEPVALQSVAVTWLDAKHPPPEGLVASLEEAIKAEFAASEPQATPVAIMVNIDRYGKSFVGERTITASAKIIRAADGSVAADYKYMVILVRRTVFGIAQEVGGGEKVGADTGLGAALAKRIRRRMAGEKIRGYDK